MNLKSTNMNGSHITVAQIGCGYWGSNVLRNLLAHEQCRVKYIIDSDSQIQNNLLTKHPEIVITHQIDIPLNDSEVDAFFIITPATTHYQLAKQTLQANKHVFVEKPLALSGSEAEHLTELSAQVDRILFVGHTFLYHDALKKISSYIENDVLGEIYYITSQRCNLGRVRSDVNVMWNLSPHDIAIIIFLFNEHPIKVAAHGTSFLQASIEDVVYISLYFPSGRFAHIEANWLHPEKIRKTTIVGTKQMLVFDDVALESKITLYDKGIRKEIFEKIKPTADFIDFKLRERTGDISIPHFKCRESLKVEIDDFIQCCLMNKQPLTNGLHGTQVVKILEAAQLSLNSYGIVIPIQQ